MTGRQRGGERRQRQQEISLEWRKRVKRGHPSNRAGYETGEIDMEERGRDKDLIKISLPASLATVTCGFIESQNFLLQLYPRDSGRQCYHFHLILRFLQFLPPFLFFKSVTCCLFITVPFSFQVFLQFLCFLYLLLLVLFHCGLIR